MFHLTGLFSLDSLTTVTTIFSAVYGVYAVATDFHETKKGKRVLSRAGTIGVAMLVISAALNMSADHFKKLKEATEREDFKAKEQQTIMLLTDNVDKAQLISKQLGDTKNELDDASRDIKNTSRTSISVLGMTDKVLRQTRRSLLPLTDLEVSAEVAVPLSQEYLTQYGERVRRMIAPYLSQHTVPHRAEVDIQLGVLNGVPTLVAEDSNDRLLLARDSPLMPRGDLGPGAETSAYSIVNGRFNMKLEVFRGDKVHELLGPEVGPQADLEMWKEWKGGQDAGIQYDLRRGALVVAFSGTPDVTRQSERYVSIPDFADSTVALTAFTEINDARFAIIPTVSIQMGGGFRLLIRPDHCKSSSPATYVCRILPGVEPQLKSN